MQKNHLARELYKAIESLSDHDVVRFNALQFCVVYQPEEDLIVIGSLQADREIVLYRGPMKGKKRRAPFITMPSMRHYNYQDMDRGELDTLLKDPGFINKTAIMLRELFRMCIPMIISELTKEIETWNTKYKQ